MLPRFPGQLNFVQIQQREGLAGGWTLQVTSLAAMGCSVVPVSPQWVLNGLWPLHPKNTTAILCLSILELVFIPLLLISELSHHSLFNSWLRQHVFNQFHPLNSFCNKYLSGFCFSVSGSPAWPRSMGTLGTPPPHPPWLYGKCKGGLCQLTLTILLCQGRLAGPATQETSDE